MTEEEWLAEDVRLTPLFDCLRYKLGIERTKQGRRQLRLFACACVRRVQHLTDVEVFHQTIRLAEQDADRPVAKADHKKQQQAILTHWGSMSDPFRRAIWTCWWKQDRFNLVQICAAQAQAARALNPETGLADFRIMVLEEREQAKIVREIFGNPFHPLKKRKFPADAGSLAQSCYEGDASLYPILADALEDLGEDAAAEHCRLTTHVKGCHVVDWVLGNELPRRSSVEE